ncbi:MAG: TonB-dependent receptor [Saprospiraceae bacterium]|nr:TonB-dependent receptor [Saprospiraceae bacterium]
MKKLLLVLSLLGFWTSQSHGQNTGQTVKGIVLDQQSETPLIGATVEWISGSDHRGTVTDIDGYFRLENIPFGRHAFQVSYLGYNSITLPNIEVSAGKEVSLTVSLEEAIEQLGEIVVTADAQKDKAQNELATISARTFSVEEVNRFSGGRSDVGRLAANFAGVSNPDDSRNDIVIRGNSPTGVLWRLEGIPIPNPNHFATLGTTGGPVSALNPNLLANSDFLTSAFPAEYGNALAGAFDLNFRNGNRDEHEFMFQMGAVSGFEGMAEGPLNKANKGSYLVAGRYSFVGLASELGLPIGTNASPNYQDVAFKLNFGNSPAGNLTFFGIGGRSDIDFLHTETDENDLFAASDEDAFAESQFGVIGLRHNLLIGSNAYLRTIAAVSTSRNLFNQDRFFNLDTPEETSIRYFETNNIENRYSLSSYYNQKFNAKLTTRFGLSGEFYDYNIQANTRENRPDLDGDGTPDLLPVYNFEEGTALLQAFGQSQYRINKSWTLNTGIHFQLLTLNSTFAVEPRVAVNYHLKEGHTINLGYGLHHQTQPLPIQLLQAETSPGIFETTNKDLDFTRSNHFVLGYDVKLGSEWRAKLETYYQLIDKVPVDPFSSSFSMLNIGSDFGFPTDAIGLVNEGTGTNIGLELTVEKFFSKGYYALLTTSIFDSKYEGSDGIVRNTAFNNGYVFNLLFGKEWRVGAHAITFDTKLTTAGGRYYTPVDLEASKIADREILQTENAFAEQYDPYFRWDAKVGFKFNSTKRKLSHHFYFDIQNVTNNDNIFARRYNRQTNEVNEVYQLGFFPDFMYRIQF